MSTTDQENSRTYDSWEHNNDAKAKRVVIRAQDPDTGSFVNISAVPNGDGTYSIASSDAGRIFKKLIDDTTTADVTYIGIAAPGTATSAASWQIKKIDESSGVVITWADAGDFDQIWDDRASLTYS